VIRILAIGDVIGKPGRQALAKHLPRAREEFAPDFVLINAENSAGGFGLTKKVFDFFIEQQQVDCLTMGNHWHDKRDIYQFIKQTDRIVLPANMMNVDEHEQGVRILTAKNGHSIAVINLIGKTFMHPDNRPPFPAADSMLKRVPDSVRVRIVDFHAEATSEKQAMGHYLSGKVSLVYGTHSHVPTADERILDRRTGFVTDVGMTGPYDSVIGIRKDAAIRRMTTGEKRHFEPATDQLWFCGIVADINEETGYCEKIQRLCWRDPS